MTKPTDETHTPHAAESQPSVRPGSDEPQTITAPTPPVAWDSEAPDRADVTDETDEGDGSEESRTHDGPGTTSRNH
ncbi:hypothetical protein [Streptomyces beigongshangae]|uniref:hypothetical protein n=1 Tax=Streptomyces beigongshangae TaxID=2841597 RepID=UPI001C84F57D|nr:hypothetical protein [Streptomyces sp. REN17]